jgi:hypothetical protein
MNLEDLFRVLALTDAITKLPSAPGYVGSLGLFAESGIRTTTVAVELKNGRLSLVPNTSRTADPTPYGTEKRSLITLSATHLPVSGVVLPDEIQDIRAFGQDSVEAGLQSQASVINDKLAELKASLEATREYQRVGALRGKILDADGSVIHDLYDLFGVVKKSLNVALANADTNVLKACLDAKRHAEKKLAGVAVRGFKALTGSDFFDALTAHPKVQAAYANWQEAADRLGGDLRTGFTFGGIEFIEYAGGVGETPFIPANVAQVFPDAPGVFKLYNAPANYNEAANTIGQAFYAKAEERRMGKGWDLEAQSNPLALCLYPEALVELKLP